MKLLTLEETGDRLGITPVSVRKLVRDGKLSTVRPLGGRAVRIVEQDIDAYIERLRDGVKE